MNEWTLPFNPCLPKEKLIVGVSGGADSMGLLLLLLENFPKATQRIIVAHVNYNLRGRDSIRDEAFVRQFCEIRRLRFKTLKVKNFKSLVIKRKRSLQDLAREIRYSFFQKLSQNEKVWGVAVGHHFEDQAETVMDRLLRGAGTRGLSGLRAQQTLNLTPGTGGLRVWRPLLGFSKKQIQEQLKSRGVSWREDHSNQRNDYRRNQIRNQILPFLERWNPRIIQVLAHVGEITSAEDVLLEEAVNKLGKKLKSRLAGNKVSCEVSEFEKIPKAFQRRWVRFTAEKLIPGARGLSFERVEEIIKLWRGMEKGPRDMGFGLIAGRKLNRAFLCRNQG